MLINLRNALMGGKKTASDIPNFPSVFYYDGIENAGAGVHSDVATTWTDLANNVGAMNIINTPRWGSDCFDFSMGAFARSASISPATTILGGTYSVEIVVEAAASGNSNGGIIAIGNNTNRTFWIWEKNGSTSFLQDIRTANVSWTVPTLTRSARHILQFSVSPTGAAFYVDGSLFQEKTVSASTQTAYNFELGRLNVNSTTTGYTSAAKGCAYLLHSRALSASEIAANYAFLSDRFNIQAT